MRVVVLLGSAVKQFVVQVMQDLCVVYLFLQCRTGICDIQEHIKRFHRISEGLRGRDEL